MKDWTKFLMAGAAGVAAGILYKNYQADQAHQAHLDSQRRRGPAGRLTDLALQAGRETGLIPASQMNGMGAMPQRAHGHRYAPQNSAPAGFYGDSGMRQSGAGNPHAPVVVPSRRRASAPPPPPPAPAGAADGGGGEAAYENYGDDNMMGGQRF